MRNFKNLFILLTLVLLLTSISCKKEAAEYDANFIGTWQATAREFYIPEDGKGYYIGFTDKGAALDVTGKVKINNDATKLKVGMVSFEINQLPTEKQDPDDTSATIFTMIIDEIEYVKQ